MPTWQADSRPAGAAPLEVEGISAGYGAGLVVRGVSVDVGAGEIVAIIGPNGSGKSTLVKAVAGVLSPACGRVILAGETVTGWRPERLARRGLGYVPQLRDVFEGLTVRENLEMGGYTLPRRAVAAQIDKVAGLFPALGPLMSRDVRKLSGGERKMVAVGRVLMTDPTALMLDEPTAGLAPKIAHHLLSEQLPRLAAVGVAVLVVEQRAAEVLRACDRGLVLVAGEVRATGSGKDLAGRADIADMFLGRTADAR